jgi:pyrroline-5-carboxylate reductase
LTKGLFEGFAQLLENYPHPALIKDAVMSPAGTTAKGYAVLEKYKVRSAFIKVYHN